VTNPTGITASHANDADRQRTGMVNPDKVVDLLERDQTGWTSNIRVRWPTTAGAETCLPGRHAPGYTEIRLLDGEERDRSQRKLHFQELDTLAVAGPGVRPEQPWMFLAGVEAQVSVDSGAAGSGYFSDVGWLRPWALGWSAVTPRRPALRPLAAAGRVRFYNHDGKEYFNCDGLLPAGKYTEWTAALEVA
jgi:hypothetical protein